MIEIMVDVYKDGSLLKTLIHDREEDWNVSDRRKYDAKGHIDITVPFNANITKSSFTLNDLSEIVQEAQVRKIKEVTIRCFYRIVLTTDDYEWFETRSSITLDTVGYDISLLEYTTFDDKRVALNDSTHTFIFTELLRKQVESSLAAKATWLSPCSTVTVRRS